MTDLFSDQAEKQLQREAPLAARMRPDSLEGFLGQQGLVGQGRLLNESIERDSPFSMILWGPPGSGKTTLAFIIARSTDSHFVALSAVSAGVRDLHKATSEARDRLGMHGKRTILFIDEIHRFNKLQQDAVLPTVENGTLTLIGATTENPSFEVNNALLSRCRVLRLEPLSEGDLQRIVRNALDDDERGLGGRNIEMDDEAAAHLAAVAGGDARIALNTLEVAAMTTPRGDGHRIRLTVKEIDEACSTGRRSTIRAGTGTSTPFPPCTRVCGTPIRTARFTGWPACSSPATIRSTSRGGSSACRWKTSVWRTPSH